jgi:hypothetical protein
MSLLRECPYCGAALDPGERCDCGLRDYESKAMAAMISSSASRCSAPSPEGKALGQAGGQ